MSFVKFYITLEYDRALKVKGRVVKLPTGCILSQPFEGNALFLNRSTR